MIATYKRLTQSPARDKSLAENALHKALRAALDESGYQQLASVSCTFTGDKVTLTGQLSGFYLSQLSQMIAWKVAGIKAVENKIHVISL